MSAFIGLKLSQIYSVFPIRRKKISYFQCRSWLHENEQKVWSKLSKHSIRKEKARKNRWSISKTTQLKNKWHFLTQRIMYRLFNFYFCWFFQVWKYLMYMYMPIIFNWILNKLFVILWCRSVTLRHPDPIEPLNRSKNSDVIK